HPAKSSQARSWSGRSICAPRSRSPCSVVDRIIWEVRIMTRSLLSWLRGGSGHKPARRSAARRGAFVARLLVLEDRTLPSTFLVSNLADSGPGSLRQAVLDANAHPGANTIRFSETLHGTIALTSGELNIINNLTLTGLGANRITVSGSDASRVFDIAA